MTLTFTISDITEKQADDIALGILLFLQETHDILVNDYSIET